MTTKRHYLELIAVLGLFGLLALMLNGIFALSAPSGPISLLVGIVASFLMSVGLLAGVALLAVRRIEAGQAEILRQLAEVRSEQTTAVPVMKGSEA